MLLQDVNGELIMTEDETSCQEVNEGLPQNLHIREDQLLVKKAQLCTRTATYLGFDLHEGKRALSASHKQDVLGISSSLTKRQMWEFLGSVGYCQRWVLEFAEVTDLLHEATKVPEGKPQPEVEAKALGDIKSALVSVLALAQSGIAKPCPSLCGQKGRSCQRDAHSKNLGHGINQQHIYLERNCIL